MARRGAWCCGLSAIELYGVDRIAPLYPRSRSLRHFSPQDAERFRYLGNLVYQAFMESANTMLPKDLPQSETWREISAALQDLRFVQHFLAETAQSAVMSALEVDDSQLAIAAAEFSRELGAIADRMDEVLG